MIEQVCPVCGGKMVKEVQLELKKNVYGNYYKPIYAKGKGIRLPGERTSRWFLTGESYCKDSFSSLKERKRHLDYYKVLEKEERIKQYNKSLPFFLARKKELLEKQRK